MTRRWGPPRLATAALAASIALVVAPLGTSPASAAGGVAYEVDTYVTPGSLVWTLPMTDTDAIFTPFIARSGGTLGDVTLNFVNPSPDAVLRISMNRERTWNAVGPFPGYWIADETVAVGGKTSVTLDFSSVNRLLYAGSEYTLAVSVVEGSVSLPLYSGGSHHEWLPMETRYDAEAEGELAASVMVSGTDGDAPTVSATVGPDTALGNRGWFTQTPTLGYECLDPTSGVVDCPDAEPLTEDGRFRRDVMVTDFVGHTSATETVRVKVDTTDPVVSLAADRPPNALGWYRYPIEVSTTAIDEMSGVAAVSEPSSFGHTLEFSGGASDVAGNLAVITQTFRVDRREPYARIVGIEPHEHFTTMPRWHAVARDGDCDSCSGINTERTIVDDVRLAKHKYRAYIVAVDRAGNRTRDGVVFFVKR